MASWSREQCVATFSIVGRDPDTGDLGVAVQSKFLAVGAVVPWLRAGVGAVATQAWANTSYGPRGLDLLAHGLAPADALTQLTGDDEHKEQRQAGIVDARGRSATFTGSQCFPWAGGIAGPNFAAQGNILVGSETVQALADTFQHSTGSLWHRLVHALAAGQRAGGDSRGKQSAALVVVREHGGYGGLNDRMIDLRVDDHPEPIDELARILSLYELYFPDAANQQWIIIDSAVASELQARLTATGDYTGPVTGTFDDATFKALARYGGRENLEERLLSDPTDARLDHRVLEYLRQQTGDIAL